MPIFISTMIAPRKRETFSKSEKERASGTLRHTEVGDRARTLFPRIFVYGKRMNKRSVCSSEGCVKFWAMRMSGAGRRVALCVKEKMPMWVCGWGKLENGACKRIIMHKNHHLRVR